MQLKRAWVTRRHWEIQTASRHLHGLAVNHAHVLWGLGEAAELDLKLRKSIDSLQPNKDTTQRHRCSSSCVAMGSDMGDCPPLTSDDQVIPNHPLPGVIGVIHFRDHGVKGHFQGSNGIGAGGGRDWGH